MNLKKFEKVIKGARVRKISENYLQFCEFSEVLTKFVAKKGASESGVLELFFQIKFREKGIIWKRLIK